MTDLMTNSMTDSMTDLTADLMTDERLSEWVQMQWRDKKIDDSESLIINKLVSQSEKDVLKRKKSF